MPGFARMPSESVVPDLVLYHSHERVKAQHQARRSAAEVARLRDLVEEFLEGHPSGEHWQPTADGGPAGWCGECLAEWPCLVERARTALYAEDGDDA